MSQPEQQAVSPLAAATWHAKQLIAAGNLPAAHLHLHEVITAPVGHPEHELAEAAVVYAYTLTGTGHPDTARAWATWAHTTSLRLHGEHHRRTLHARHILAVVHQRTGNHHQAVTAWRHLVGALTTLDGPHAGRTLAARADYAVALHTAGACDHAHTELTDAVTIRHRQRGSDRFVVKMLTRLAGMWRDCGNPARADTCYTRARALAQHLDARLAARVTAVASSPPDPAHAAACTHIPAHRQATHVAPGQA